MITKPTMPSAWPGLMPAEYYGNAYRPPEKVKPHARHSDPDWQIHPGANVQRTWERFGWKPTTR